MKKLKEVPDELPIAKLDLSTVLFPLIAFPWPFKDGSVEEISCVHVFNKIPGKLRGQFMDECYRVLKTGGTLSIITPYITSMRAYADYDYEWPPIVESSFLFFNREWRTNQNVHSELKCDFDFGYGYNLPAETANRAQEVRDEWIKVRWNAVQDGQITLTKRP